MKPAALLSCVSSGACLLHSANSRRQGSFSSANFGLKDASRAHHAAFSLVALKWRIVLGGAPLAITAVLHQIDCDFARFPAFRAVRRLPSCPAAAVGATVVTDFALSMKP
jgi:hypothetical protein